MRSRGFGGAAIVALLLVGCGGRPPVKEKEAAAPPTPTEVKVTPLTNAKVTAGRAAGYLPSLTVPYAPVEILGPPAGLATPTEACVAAGKGTAIINNSGVVVGYDCRNNPGAWMPSGGLAYYPLYSAARTVGPLSTATANVLPTFALPVPTNNRGAMPFAINDSGTIAGYAYPTDQNLVNQGRWPGVIWESGSYPSPYTLTNLDSLWTVGGITNGVKPKLVGGDWNADWITYDTASATAPTVLADPASGLGLGNLYGTNSWGDLVGNYQKSDGTWWAWARKDGAWVDINAVAQTPHPFARIEGLRAVNDSRRAVGWGIFPGGTASSWTRRALQYDLVTNTVTLIPISPNRTYQGQEFIAKGINAKGHVVGAFMGGGALGTIGVYPQGKGWVWTPEYGIRELDTFINPALGLSIGDGHAINDYDEVAALDARVISGAWKVQLLRTKVDFGGPEFIEPSAGLNCSMASAINNAGAVTGWSDACANNPWPSAGQAIPFATTASGAPVRLGSPTDPGGIHATAINEAGNVVATRFVSATSTFAPVVYRAGHWDVAAEQPSGITGAASLAALDEDTASGGPRLFGSEYVAGVGQTWFSYFDGTKTALPRLASANTDGALLGANDAGEAVGFFGTSSGLAAAVYTGGATTALSASGWTSLNAAFAINAAHQVVGYGVKGGATRAFKMTLGGNTVEIPALESPYANLAHVARAINAAGQVVGTAGTVDLLGHVTGQRAFIFSEDTGITDLNALTAMPAGWVLADASGINDSGEVVGYAVDAAGVRRAYKMKVPAMPVTECAGKADGASCNDLNRCTQNDTCQAGVCVGSNPVVCNGTPNQCQLAQTCDVNTGLCVFPNKAAYTACNDNNPCSLTDACFNGVCTGTTFKQCVAKDQCHVAGVCDTGTGQCPDPVGNEGAACNDGNACTTASVCTAGTCTGTTQAPPCASGTTCDPATTTNYLPEGVPQSALAALWHMDDHRDSSENAAHWAVASSALPSKVVPGKVGGALEFEGTHWLGVSSPYYHDVTDAPGFTFAAWVKPNVTCPGTYGFLRRDWQFGLKLTCSAGGTPGLQVGMNTGTGPFSSLSYSAAMGAVPVGQWSHIAMTWDKQTIRIYVNGAEAGTVSKSGNLPAPVGYFQLGWNENYYRGTIDEAVLYRQALTPAQLATITTVAPNACKVPTCPVPANTCQVATYDAATSACVTTNKANGASCSDGNACTVGDTCLSGTCVAGAGAPTCSTTVTCQESTCDPQWKETPPADVVSLWHLDGNLTEPAGHNLTGTASVAAVAGKFGQAMHFDGVATSCATRPSTSGESFTNPAGVTIAAWVKPDSNACPSGVQHMIVNRAAEVGLNLVCSGNYLLIRPQLNTVEYNSLGAIPTGVWSHVAITYDPPTGKLDAYHNGARIGTWSVPPGTQVGTSQYGRGLTLQVGCGAAAAVDEAIVIRRSSTAAEIANMAGSPSLCNEHPKTCLATDTCHTNGTCDPQTGQCPAPPAKQAGAPCSDDNACTTGDTCNAAGQCVAGTPVSVSCAAPATCKEAGVCKTDEAPVPPALGRVGWWRFEGDTRDSGGQGLDLVRNGGTVGEGRIGKAFEFDGNTCMHMTNALPPITMTGATAISMMAWVKTSSGWTCPASGYRAIMGKGYDYSLDASCSGVNTPGLTHVFRNQAGTVDNGPTPVVGAQPQNAWTHVAVVWDGSTIRRYVNGAYVSNKTFAGIPQNVDPSFSIGCQTSLQGATFSNGYKGSIDEAVLYNRVLTDAEISTYYGAASAHSCSYADQANGTACTGDADACTKEACQAGSCVADGVVTCVAQDLCHTAGTCDPATGCSNPPVTCTASDGCHAAGVCDPVTGCSNPHLPGGTCVIGAGNVQIFESTIPGGCSHGTAINNAGQVVGYSAACTSPPWPAEYQAYPFAAAGGQSQELPLTLDIPSAFGTSISPSGFIVGNTSDGRALLYRSTTSVPETLPFAGGRVTGARTTVGYGNWPTVIGSAADQGHLVWASYDVQGAEEPGAQPTMYPLGGGASGAALATNAEGDLVGYYGYENGARTAMIRLTADGVVQSLQGLTRWADDWILTAATAINGTTVVGYGVRGTSPRPFKVDLVTGNVTDLSIPSDLMPAGLVLRPTGINSSGHIVGTALSVDSFGEPVDVAGAFVYTDLSRLQDLNDYIQMPPGWAVASVAGINDNDEVTGIVRNPSGQRRAFKVTVPGLPDVAQLACAGKQDGDDCSPGRTCEANNVCHHGVCGGGDPSDAFCLKSEGVVDVGGGKVTAVFGYTSFSTSAILPNPNQQFTDGVIVPYPQPPLPAWLPKGSSHGVFLPTFSAGANHSVSWRANGQKATARGLADLVPDPNPSGDGTIAVTFPGQKVIVRADLSAFKAAPDDPSDVSDLAQVPSGDPFYGTLEGQLGVSPLGAATFSVPFAIPPGIAGMSPVVGLAYNSQGGDGIAGQGWELTGLSTIQRCPKTRAQDGMAEPVDMKPFDTKTTVCLDGKRLFRQADGSYQPEIKDFSDIKKLAVGFAVVTKQGETRYYGTTTDSRVGGPVDIGDGSVVWALDRVVDQWGNYFTFTYESEPLVNGLLVKSINYTGHLPGPNQAPQAPFREVAFTYEDRQDVRRVRFREIVVPRLKRLKSVSTDLGTYTLTYINDSKEGTPQQSALDKAMLPSQLYEISYCSRQDAAHCSEPLRFEWEGGGFALTRDYLNPFPTGKLDRYWYQDHHTWANRGTRLVDINGDGRIDVVESKPGVSRATVNRGGYWDLDNSLAPPQNIVDGDGFPTGSVLADVNGDGVVDLVAERGPSAATFCSGTPTVCKANASPAVYINNIRGGGTTWLPDVSFSDLPADWGTVDLSPGQDILADMDGDGRVDLVRRVFYRTPVWNPFHGRVPPGYIGSHPEYAAGAGLPFGGPPGSPDYQYPPVATSPDAGAGDGGAAETEDPYDYLPCTTKDVYCTKKGKLKVLLNTGHGWVDPGERYSFTHSPLTGTIESYHVEDINGDGIADLVSDDPVNDNGIPSYRAGLNSASASALNVWRKELFEASPGYNATQGTRVMGDVDGDGISDSFQFYDFDGEMRDVVPQPDPPPVPKVQEGWYVVRKRPSLSFGTAFGFTEQGAAPYLDAVQTLGPDPAVTEFKVEAPGVSDDYHFALSDLNADGLADLILSHPDNGQILVNTGRTWKDINGRVSRTHLAGTTSVAPAVPSDFVNISPFVGAATTGAAFIDVNADGVVDLVRNVQGEDAKNGVWINQFKPPVIREFPNGLASPTKVDYQVITTAAAANAGTYTPVNSPSPTSRPLGVPLRVVSAVSKEDGRAIGAYAKSTYKYEGLRTSSVGRSIQGFLRTIVTEPSDVVDPNDASLGTIGTETTTTYAQVFPYTGMPLTVTKKKGTTVLSQTTNTYCDRAIDYVIEADCAGQDGPSAGDGVVSGVPLAVAPIKVVDIAYPIGGIANESITTTTTYRYDSRGNAKSVAVEVSRTGGAEPSQTYRKTTTNDYGASDSDECKLGRPIATTITSERLNSQEVPIVRRTAFDYDRFGGYLDAGVEKRALALKKTRIEPGSYVGGSFGALPRNETELHTTYDYDRFGNVTTTTSCASDFSSCDAGATNPAAPSDPQFHPQFRTTRVSYDQQQFNAPSGSSLQSSLAYQQDGRFPVKVTNPAGLSEYFAYDPATGLLLQKTNAAGVHTCYRYDEFGRQEKEIARCGSAKPTEAVTKRYWTPGGQTSLRTTLTVLLTTGRAPTWTYTDPLGRPSTSFTLGFDGEVVQTSWVTFDRLGRVSVERKPKAGGTEYTTSHHYSRLGPETVTTQELGQIDDGPPAFAKTLRTIQGSTIETTDVIPSATGIGGLRSRSRKETKNVLGKVSRVEDVKNKTIDYEYDVAGNLLRATDDAGNVTWMSYDVLGRKRYMDDPDLGEWSYGHNGFGDLAIQRDAKGAVTSSTYDDVGRLTSKTDESGTSEWLFDPGTGLLTGMVGPVDERLSGGCVDLPSGLSGGNRPAKWFVYNGFGDVSDSFECIDGTTFKTHMGYDELERPVLTEYPAVSGTSFAVVSHYTSLGHLHYLSELGANTTIWTAKAQNVLGQVTKEVLRNGVETTSNRNLATGWLRDQESTALADGGKLIQDWSYRYDGFGNLKKRFRSDDLSPGSSVEDFAYDDLDRITSSSVIVDGPENYTGTETFEYDDLGNLTKKGAKIQRYGSGCEGPAGPHALCSVDDGQPFKYDANGNLTVGNSRVVDYNASNKPTRIVSAPPVSGGNDSGLARFSYGADDARVLQVIEAPSGSGTAEARTVYVGLGSRGRSAYERTTTGSKVEHSQFVYGPDGNLIAIRTTTTHVAATSEARFAFFHHDHLGSITAISDETGHVVDAVWGNGKDSANLGYDAWGGRRSPDGRAANAASFNLQVGHREYTGHETIPNVGLINMNGRVYDSAAGRFLTPDPTIQFSANLQGFNRYSYALNNPLRYTDPTGYTIVDDTMDSVIGAVLAIGAAATCASGYGAAYCVPAIAVAIAWNSAVMASNGASWEQIVAVQAGTLVITAMTMGIGSQVSSPLAGMLLGMASDASMQMMTASAMGTDPWDGPLDFALSMARSAAQNLFSSAISAAGAAASRGEGFACAPDEDLWPAWEDGYGAPRKFTINKVHFEIVGGSEKQQIIGEAIVRDIMKTGAGANGPLRALMNRNLDGSLLKVKDPAFIGTTRTYTVALMKNSVSKSPQGANWMAINVRKYPVIMTSQGLQGASVVRQIAHEFGHSAMGFRDDGPRSMFNVDMVENPIMRELRPTYGEMYDRVQYDGEYGNGRFVW